MSLNSLHGCNCRLTNWTPRLFLLAFLTCVSFTSRAQPPIWGDDDVNGRFELLSNFDNRAVLDYSTGLVWLFQPLTVSIHDITTPGYIFPFTSRYQFAIEACEHLSVDGKLGWRVPSVQEMTTMVRASPGIFGFGANARGCRMAEGLPTRNATLFTSTRDVSSPEDEHYRFRYVVVRRSRNSTAPCIQDPEPGRSVQVMCVWNGSGHALTSSRKPQP